MKLEDRVAIVTGAAQGIGRAVAEKLDAEGATVVIADLNAEGAQTAAGALERGERDHRQRGRSRADRQRRGARQPTRRGVRLRAEPPGDSAPRRARGHRPHGRLPVLRGGGLGDGPDGGRRWRPYEALMAAPET